MNDVYFYCPRCKEYINAGYRWAYWMLEETQLVNRKNPIDVEAVIGESSYWAGSNEEDGAWLESVLSQARSFISKHREHGLKYGDEECFFNFDETDWDWLDCSDYLPDESPRFYVERLGFRSWDQVENRIENGESTPWWWYQKEHREPAKAAFQRRLEALETKSTNSKRK